MCDFAPNSLPRIHYKQADCQDGVREYDFAICELYGVQIVGLPSDIELVRASLWNLETVRRVRAGLKEGSVCWVKMTKTEHEALIAKHNALRAESASGSLRQRATRLDKGTRRKKTGEKEGTGRVQSTARAAFAGTAGDGGAVVPLTTNMPINPTPALIHPTAALIHPATAPVDPTAAPVNPTAAPAAPVDPTPASVDPTPASVDPTPAPVDPSLAFNMHLDPAVLEEFLSMPPYEGPLLPLDFDDVNSNMYLFNIPQDPPAPLATTSPSYPTRSCPRPPPPC
jgi:hypothetical protein